MTDIRRHAILIGNSEFSRESGLDNLRCPPADVRGLAEVLSSPENGLFEESQQLINESKSRIERTLNHTFKQAGRNDQILVYYSGHGKPDAAGHLHLATADTESDLLETTSIAVGLLRKLIDNHACKQVALILDCCFGGLVSKDFLKSGTDDHLQSVFRDRGIYILTASTSSQAAREKNEDKYSLFTKHILHGIREGVADLDGDGHVSMEDLYLYVSKQVPKEAPQYPRKWAFEVQGNALWLARVKQVYTESQLQAFRKAIKSAVQIIDEEVYDHALEIIREKEFQRDKAFFTLLKLLQQNNLKPAIFESRWLKLLSHLRSLPSISARTGQAPLPQTARQDQSHFALYTRSEMELFLVAIAREIDMVMQREMFKPPSGPIYIPNEYLVFLSPDDNSFWHGDRREGLQRGLFNVISARAREVISNQEVQVKSFAIELRVDTTLERGKFRVQPVWNGTQPPQKVRGSEMLTPKTTSRKSLLASFKAWLDGADEEW